MRFSSFRTYWISLISLLVMLMSGVASGSTMMAMDMLPTKQVTPHTASSNVLDCQMTDWSSNPHAHHTNIPKTSSTESPHCGSMDDMETNCCTLVCVSVFAFLASDHQAVLHRTALALVPTESNHALITFPRSLYRPPIA
ncbi:hypothetical protein [Enterovibrio norvegicus]|uniref:DUF2946 domain-containing protein n=1 Tax=Enterovibrio norvegicus TaxID=188144 RepID=A0ABV4L3D4_9GAMM|nr:hypothetical protein [Enterovibrio norvegicus]